ncbi:peptidoglycan hydrolase CwlO-like protein [Nitrobacteraceae bacterium AZCC 1564]
MKTSKTRLVLVVAALTSATGAALAQDVVGIEICTAEKTMERRTSCLQSNINFLKSTMTKASLESQQKIDAANRQIDALKATVIGLQKTVEQLQGQVQALEKKPAEASKPPAKEPAAK